VNAVQSMKAVINNFQAVRRGGAIIFTAQCAEGIAPWLRELCGIRDREELERRIAAGELRHPHNALFLRRATEHAHVVMVSNLAAADVAGLGFHKADSIEAATDLATRLAGAPERTVVVPFGNTTVVRVGEGRAVT
jgi:nickel-dependent lactate racemase